MAYSWNITNLFHASKFGISQVPVDLVIDHSVQVDVARSANAVQANMDLEFQRNNERFAFLKWGSHAFDNMLVVPPGSGIVHQVKIYTFKYCFCFYLNIYLELFVGM